jgi:hypothetical protein
MLTLHCSAAYLRTTYCVVGRFRQPATLRWCVSERHNHAADQATYEAIDNPDAPRLIL